MQYAQLPLTFTNMLFHYYTVRDRDSVDCLGESIVCDTLLGIGQLTFSPDASPHYTIVKSVADAFDEAINCYVEQEQLLTGVCLGRSAPALTKHTFMRAICDLSVVSGKLRQELNLLKIPPRNIKICNHTNWSFCTLTTKIII